MFTKLLESLGLVNTHDHLGGSIFWNIRNIPMNGVIQAPEDFVVILPFRETHRLILGGQFCVGHVEYT
jgi:hypothetical protein